MCLCFAPYPLQAHNSPSSYLACSSNEQEYTSPSVMVLWLPILFLMVSCSLYGVLCVWHGHHVVTTLSFNGIWCSYSDFLLVLFLLHKIITCKERPTKNAKFLQLEIFIKLDFFLHEHVHLATFIVFSSCACTIIWNSCVSWFGSSNCQIVLLQIHRVLVSRNKVARSIMLNFLKSQGHHLQGLLKTQMNIFTLILVIFIAFF